MTVVDSEDLRPGWPGVISCAILGRLWKQFEINQRFAAVSKRRADTVSAGIAAADDNNMLVFGRDMRVILQL